MLRHKALGFQWHVPALGEEVSMWRSHDKKQAKSAHHKGAVGRLIAIDPWGNGTCVLVAKGVTSMIQSLYMVFAQDDCCRMSSLEPATSSTRRLEPRCIEAICVQMADHLHTPDGKDLWLKMDTGQTQYTSPFVAEIKPDSSDLAEEHTAYWGEATDPANAVVRPEVVVFQPPVDQPMQVRNSLTKTVRKARIIPNRVVMSTSGCKRFSRQLGRNQLQSCERDISLTRRKSSCNYWFLA